LILIRKYGRFFFVVLILLSIILVIYEAWPEKLSATVIRGYNGFKGSIIKTKGLSVQFWYKDKLYATKDCFVYQSNNQGVSWEKVARLEPSGKGLMGWLKDKVARLRVVQFLRAKKCGPNLRILQDGTLLAAAGGIYRGHIENIEKGKIIYLYKTHTGPTMLHQGWTEDSEGIVYFGEYQVGKKHSVTRLYWSLDKGRTWKVRYEFPRSEIRHIHAVQFDPFRKLLWVATGDRDHESRILFSSDKGMTFKKLGGGSQAWRAVSLQFSSNAIYWGTDSPRRENHIFKWQWSSGQKGILVTVRTPFYYSFQDSNQNIFYATTAERLENSIPDIFSELWQINNDGSVRRLIKWPKGGRKSHGIIQFAQGVAVQNLIAFTPINLKGHHCEALVAELSR
jgi:hypothetical protein